MGSLQDFGGNWTQQKLWHVEEYLKNYMRVMSKQNFKLIYIDAFAGTGYRTNTKEQSEDQLVFPEFLEDESREFIDGSARIALKIQPPFSEYIFVEKSPRRFQELEKLKQDHPELSQKIRLIRDDCNSFLREFCRRSIWQGARAVLFLDPYGMQVSWDTIAAIAATKAIDLWVLFPLGVAVNRMLKRDGTITDSWRSRLDILFGSPDWYQAFYRSYEKDTLFGHLIGQEKTANFNSIAEYFNGRLQSVFAKVAENPRQLMNTVNNPLYLLCFAAGNPKGAPIAVRIAEHLLRM